VFRQDQRAPLWETCRPTRHLRHDQHPWAFDASGARPVVRRHGRCGFTTSRSEPTSAVRFGFRPLLRSLRLKPVSGGPQRGLSRPRRRGTTYANQRVAPSRAALATSISCSRARRSVDADAGLAARVPRARFESAAGLRVGVWFPTKPPHRSDRESTARSGRGRRSAHGERREGRSGATRLDFEAQVQLFNA